MRSANVEGQHRIVARCDALRSRLDVVMAVVVVAAAMVASWTSDGLAQQSRQLVCRGGGAISFTLSASPVGMDLLVRFDKVAAPAGADGGVLAPGQCGWSDAAMTASDCTIVTQRVLAQPGYSFVTFEWNQQEQLSFTPGFHQSYPYYQSLRDPQAVTVLQVQDDGRCPQGYLNVTSIGAATNTAAPSHVTGRAPPAPSKPLMPGAIPISPKPVAPRIQ